MTDPALDALYEHQPYTLGNDTPYICLSDGEAWPCPAMADLARKAAAADVLVEHLQRHRAIGCGAWRHLADDDAIAAALAAASPEDER